MSLTSVLAYGSMIRAEKDVGSLIDRYGSVPVKTYSDEMIRLGKEGMHLEIRRIRG